MKKEVGQQIQKEFQGVHWRVMNLYSGQIKSTVGWTLSWAHFVVLCVVAHPNSYTCTTFLRKPAKEELMEEDGDVCSILGELEDLQESSDV